MTERGILSNSAAGAWVRYKPDVLCAGSGGETQPFFDTFDGTIQYGRYLLDNDGCVSVQIQTEFVAATTVGAGSAYVWRLPVKAKRCGTAGQACPVPIGIGMTYFTFNTNPFPAANMHCVATLADPHASLGGAEDFYAQLYAPRVWDWGDTTDALGNALTIPQSQKALTVNHAAGFAPSPAHIHVVYKGTLGTNAVQPPFVANITSTTFDAKLQATVTTNNVNNTFSYKIDAPPPSGSTGPLVSPKVPWDWTKFSAGSPFGYIFIELEYEAA